MPHPTTRTFRWIALVLPALVAAAGGALAQVAEQVPLGGQSAAEGVYVRDSSRAVDRFALADRLASLGEWGKAAEVYREVAEELGSELVSARGEQGMVYQYRPVADAVRDRLTAWPVEGREAYRDLYGGQAERALSAARQFEAQSPERLDALEQIVRREFLTGAAVEAAIELIDRHLAAGRFGVALRTARSLLDQHPDLATMTFDDVNARAALLLRAATAAHFAGEAELSQTLAFSLREQFPQESGSIGGGESVLLADAAEALRENPVPPERPLPADIWPTLGGNDTRGRIAPATPGTVTPLWAIEMPPAEMPGEQPRSLYERSYNSARRLAQMTGIFPAVYEGVAYWTDNIRVFAIGLDSRLPPAEWVASHPGGDGEPAGVYHLDGGGWPTPRGTVLAPLATSDRLYVPMGERDENLADQSGRGQTAPAQLVALDRETGRQLWTARPAAFDRRDLPELSDEDAEALGDTRFVGVPLEAGGVIWSLAKTDPRRARQFEQCWLVGLDPDTGRPIHTIYLATSVQAQLRYQQQQYIPEPHPPLSAANGLVFAPTGRGVLAAVSAADGRVRWVDLYERNAADVELVNGRVRRERFSRLTGGQAFHVSPPIVAQGRIFYRPPDADAILIYDTESGERLARLPVTALLPGENVEEEEGDAIRSLLAVSGDRLYALASNSIYFLNWPAMVEDAAAGRADDEARMDWVLGAAPVDPPRRDDDQPMATEHVLGRPAVTKTHIVVPSARGLALIDLETGRRADAELGDHANWESLPPAEPYGASGDDGEPTVGEVGNVIVVEDRILVAGATTLSLFADREAVRQRLIARRDASPNDPEPRLRLAELEFAAGNWQASVEGLREAAQLDNGKSSVFTSALAMVRSPARRRVPDAEAAAAAMLEVASETAAGPQQQVAVRFARARAGTGGPEAGLVALQEVLAEPTWRRVALPDGTPAREAAARIINDLIADAGPELYREVEARAAAELAEAGTDADALRRVADVYPNSQAAREALTRTADVRLQQDRPLLARAALRELRAGLLASNDATAAAEVAVKLAQVEAQLGRLDLAAARLRNAARSVPNLNIPELAVPDGEPLVNVRADEAAFALTEQALAEDAARTPALNIPTDPASATFVTDNVVVAEQVGGVAAILPTPREATRHDRLPVRLASGAVAVFEFGESKPLWTADVSAVGAEAAAWRGKELLVWGAGGAARLDANGKVLWTTRAGTLAPESLQLATAQTNDALAQPLRRETDRVMLAQLEAQLAGLDLRVEDDDRRAEVAHALRVLRAAADEGRLELEQREETNLVRFVAGEREAVLHVWPTRGVIERPPGGFTQVLRRADDLGGNVVERIGTIATATAISAPTSNAQLMLAAPTLEGIVAVISEGGSNPASLVLIDGADGSRRWAAPLDSGWPAGLSVAGDYATVRIEDAVNGGETLLASYDLLTGRQVATRRFENGLGDGLANFLALPSNELVTVTGRIISVIDLEDPEQATEGARGTVGISGDRGNAVAFLPARVTASPAALSDEQQWLGDPTGGRLTAVGDDLIVFADPRQAGRRDAMVVDLNSLAMRRVIDPTTQEPAPLLLVGGEDAEEADDLALLPGRERERRRRELQQRLVERGRGGDNGGWPGERAWTRGTHVYVGGKRGLGAHDLTAPDGTVGPHWMRDNDPLLRSDNAVNLDLMIGDDFVLLVDAPQDLPQQRAAQARGETASIRITPFSRQIIDGKGYESGLQHRAIEVGNGLGGLAGAPQQWQALDGGLAVLDDAGRLAFIPGAAGE